MGNTNYLRGMIYGKYKSISEFAKQIGWTKQKANRIVNGKTQPSLSDLDSICKELGISVDQGINFFMH